MWFSRWLLGFLLLFLLWHMGRWGVQSMGIFLQTVRQGTLLKETLREKEALLQTLQGVSQENERLHHSLGFRDSIPTRRPLLAAQVIGRSPSEWSEVVLVNRGSAHGVHKNQAVISEQGLVGKVARVLPRSAEVSLITDPRSAVSAQTIRTEDVGVVTGERFFPLRMEFIPPEADVQAGDTVMTSGLSSIYPAGIGIGSIESVKRDPNALFLDVRVRPAVSFSRLQTVFVVK